MVRVWVRVRVRVRAGVWRRHAPRTGDLGESIQQVVLPRCAIPELSIFVPARGEHVAICREHDAVQIAGSNGLDAPYAHMSVTHRARQQPIGQHRFDVLKCPTGNNVSAVTIWTWGSLCRLRPRVYAWDERVWTLRLTVSFHLNANPNPNVHIC